MNKIIFVKIIMALLGLIFFRCGSSKNMEIDAEFAALEKVIISLSTQNQNLLKENLDQLRSLNFSHEPIIAVQNQCIKAYEEYAAVLFYFEKTKKQVETLEEALAKTDVSDIQARQIEASSSILKTNEKLDMAEKLVAECFIKRDSLKKQLKL